MTKKVLLTIIAIVIVAVAAILLWRFQERRVESKILKGLTKDEVVLLLKNQSLFNPEKTDGIVSTAEGRKKFLQGMKEYLALAARARREGYADDQNFKLNMQIKEQGMLAQMYLVKLNSERKEPFTFSKEQIDAVWANSENEKEFNAEMDAMYAIQRINAERIGNSAGTIQPLLGESLEKARITWARAKILSDMARKDNEFMQQPIVQLRRKILEAGLLSGDYLTSAWAKHIKATEEEITAYIVTHPQYDVNKKHEVAEAVLRRAKAGEDFNKLAKEFSEDRSTKDSGGLYKDYVKGGGLWLEVESAALSLEKGQIADRLVETSDGFHIVQLVDKQVTKNTDGTEMIKLSIRHILLQRRFEDPSVERAISIAPAPFKTPEEIAKGEIEKEKRKRFIDEIIKSEGISLPEDFDFVNN